MKLALQYFDGWPIDFLSLSRVIESKNPSYPVGSYIYGHFGWRSLTLVTALDDSKVHPIKPYPCPDLGKHPRSYALGCCGRVGYVLLHRLR